MDNQIIDLSEFGELKEFRPVAYFDEPSDCIQVYTRDCSITAHLLTSQLSLFEGNHRIGEEPKYVGFLLYGIERLFLNIGLKLGGAYTVGHVIDKYIEMNPVSVEARNLDMFVEMVPEIKELGIEV